MMRRVLAILLLLAQALALVHLVDAPHAVGESGAAIEAQPDCAEPKHAASGVEHGHAATPDDGECAALSLLRSAGHVTAAAALESSRCTAASRLRPSPAHGPISVLSVAPKGSPPA